MEDKEEIIVRCDCGEDSYLDVTAWYSKDPEWTDLYVGITLSPTRWFGRFGRLKLAWKALRGLEFSASNQVIVDKKDAGRLAELLDKYAKNELKV